MKAPPIKCQGKCVAVARFLKELTAQLATTNLIHSPASLPVPGVGKQSL